MNSNKNQVIILVNEQDKVTGYTEKFTAHKNPVPLHRAISVVVLDPSGKKMLLQKRAKTKPTWPLFWSNACCTHPYKNEAYSECAARRLSEEMRFQSPLVEKFRFIYSAKFNSVWGEHEYDVVFEGRYEGEVKPEPEEAADWKWLDIKELLVDVKNNPGIYTPWFKIILEKLYEVKGTVGPEVFVEPHRLKPVAPPSLRRAEPAEANPTSLLRSFEGLPASIHLRSKDHSVLRRRVKHLG